MSDKPSDPTLGYGTHVGNTAGRYIRQLEKTIERLRTKVKDAEEAVQMIYTHPEQPLEVQTWATNALAILSGKTAKEVRGE